MEELDINYILDYYHRRLRNVTTKFHRYLYNEINWSSRLIGIMGARGVGKTTMLLQRIVEKHTEIDNALYATLDSLWFQTHTLSELAEYADLNGIEFLYLDEVHRYPNWAIELKQIVDLYPEMHIVYTGSSMLEIDHSKADLSRRQTLYTLAGMSFREYLKLVKDLSIEPLTLEDVLKRHTEIAFDITSKTKIIPAFQSYLKKGYYPFLLDTEEDYLIRLSAVISTVIDVDIPSVQEISQETIEKAKKLVMVLAEGVPQIMNLTDLFHQINTTRDHGLKILNLLSRGGILTLLSKKPKNYKRLVVPEKILLQNSNQMYALTAKANTGTAREAFFANQLSVKHKIDLPAQGDFMVDEKHLFEVGGKNKTFNQIADIPDSYLAVDDTEIGRKNRIPLWLFGLLY